MMEMAVEVLRRMDLQPSPCEQVYLIITFCFLFSIFFSLYYYYYYIDGLYS